MPKRLEVLVVLMCLTQYPLLTSSQNEEVDNTSLSELEKQLEFTTQEALLLFTEYSSRSSHEMLRFLKQTPSLANEVLERIHRDVMERYASGCRRRLEARMRALRHNAHIAAEYNAANHQKFYLAHMIVFRVHLNKSQEFIKRSHEVLRTCPSPCRSVESRNNLFRWYRAATEELHRVRDDVQHSRKAFQDLLLHGHKRLLRIKRKAQREAIKAVKLLQNCSG